MGCDILTTPDGEINFRVAKQNLYDGVCPFDYATTVLVFVAVVTNIAFALLGLYYREWPPLKAKQPYLIALAALGGTIWALASLMTNSISDQMVDDGFRNLCWLHRYLGQILGFTIWSACLMIRLWRLYAVLNRNTVPMATWKLLTLCLLPATGLILGGILRNSARPCVMVAGGHLDQVYVMNGQLVSHSSANALIKTCCLCTDWQFGLFAYCFAFYFSIIAGAFLLRNARQSFNELRETTVTTVVALLAFILTAIVAFLPWGGTCAGRNINTIVTMVSISMPTFMIAGPWVVGRLINPKEAEARFWLQMKAESQEHANRGRPASTTDAYSIHSSSSSLQQQQQEDIIMDGAGGRFSTSGSPPPMPSHLQVPSRPARTQSSFGGGERSSTARQHHDSIIVPPLNHNSNSGSSSGRGYSNHHHGVSGPLSPRHHDRKPSADDDSFVSMPGSMQ